MSSPALFATLPFELLAEIFLFSLPQKRLNAHRELVRTVVRLSAVCSTWRQVAIGTTSLWNTISVGRDFSVDETPDNVRDRVTAFAEASNTAPFELSIGPVNNENTWWTCWTVITPHLERCCVLHIEVPDEVGMEPLWQILGEQHFRSLQLFFLLDSRQRLLDNAVDGPLLRLGRGPLPALKTLIHVITGPAPPLIPIAPSLSTLVLAALRLTPPQALSFLANYTSVIKLTVKHVRFGTVDVHGSVVLPELRILIIDSPVLLANLVTPELETLSLEEVTFSGWSSAPNQAPTGGGIFSSLAGLKSLRFTGCDLGNLLIVTELLAAAGMVESLEINHCPEYAQVLLSLLLAGVEFSDPESEEPSDTHHKEQNSILFFPHLAHLTFTANPSEEFDAAEIMINLLARRPSLHVECDLAGCRDYCENPSTWKRHELDPQSLDDAAFLSYFGGRLIVQNPR